ncbi:MAG: anaerobic ribonucleoside-triphosphate reductase activating protein [Lachnospiraceae bacterium]|nr:anaerobic ribonucleoside-triphosphate reductase activating protein [Lachnospiraceae bacterium]
MDIHGLNKTTLLDYPGRVASTIFAGACNMRCPFCQNADLVLDPASQPLISEEEVLAHIRKRKGIITGVCITGGEPTLQKDLLDFMRKIKDIGMDIKLDSNGYRPEVLRQVIDEGLADYIAMDIKSSPAGYERAAGVPIDMSRIRESISLIMGSGSEYEFRTTVVRELHDEETFEDIGELIKGAERYFLQSYVDSDRVILPGFSSYSKEELEKYCNILHKYVKTVSIRGVD